MLRLHVFIDLIVSPSGRWMISGLFAGWTLRTGAPGATKCYVAPTSAMAWFTAILIAIVLIIVSAWFALRRLFFRIVFSHAFCLVGKLGEIPCVDVVGFAVSSFCCASEVVLMVMTAMLLSTSTSASK